jgi:spermidine synthase
VSRFQELDYCETPIGAISLRRRYDPKLGTDVFEIKLDDAFLMTSYFTSSEVALAELGLAAIASDTAPLDVVVGGLGLGYTARAVLTDRRVTSMLVVEALEPVIDWHRRALVPLGAELCADDRCRLVHGDFFAMAASAQGFDRDAPARRFHAILVDIDHSPACVLDPRHASLYTPDGLRRLATHLHPGGVFGLWSNERPDDAFTARLADAFNAARAEPVTFHNPLQDRPFTQTVYLAHR